MIVRWGLGSWGWVLCAGLAAAEPAAEPVDSWQHGEQLFEELRCSSCHVAPGLDLATFEAPRLTEIGARIRPSWLRAWLRDPHAARPGVKMPDVLGTLPAGEREVAIDELVHFLASLGGPFEESAEPLSASALEHGRQLYHSVGCVACHDAHELAADLEVPLWGFAGEDELSTNQRSLRSLAHLPSKTNAPALAEFLLDPVAVHPDGRMPSLRLSSSEARDIATYLTTAEVLEGRLDLEFGAGLAYRYVEGDLDDELTSYTSVEPARTGTWDQLDELPENREDDYGFLFEGFVDVPTDGLWTFATSSDDGSMLRIDGEIVVDNGGDHGMSRKAGEVDLTSGRHAITITYYENTGGDGLEVEWSGPGVETETIPAAALSHWVVPASEAAETFELDPQQIERGRRRYGELGCVACHPLEGIAARATRTAPALKDLSADGGCLDRRGAATAPRFVLGAHQRAEIAAFLADPDRNVDRTASEELERTLTRLDCFACHARDGHGGPSDEKQPYFVGEEGVDLGNEGRFPPHLERVGWKLKEEWLDDFLENGGTVRPYLETRMPQFGTEHVGDLARLFAEVDRGENLVAFFAERGLELPNELPRRPEDVEVGAKLAGTKGLGCVQCHVYGPHGSTGIRSVDLTEMTKRIDSRWFRELLLDPKSVGMNSRMPEFLVDGGKSPVTDIFDGDAERQVEALWSALSMGAAMPLPEGLLITNEAFELLPVDGPKLISVFMKDVGPHVLLVGSPNRIHYAYDIDRSRLVAAWTGEFFNARGTWYNRAGALETVGENAIEFPQGLPFAILPSHPGTGGEWPEDSGLEYRRLGRNIDGDGYPSYRYSLRYAADQEPVIVTESVRPELSPTGPSLKRRFEITMPGELANDPSTSEASHQGLWLRIAHSEEEPSAFEDPAWNVAGVRIRPTEDPQRLWQFLSAGESLVVPIPEQQTTVVEIEYSW